MNKNSRGAKILFKGLILVGSGLAVISYYLFWAYNRYGSTSYFNDRYSNDEWKQSDFSNDWKVELNYQHFESLLDLMEEDRSEDRWIVVTSISRPTRDIEKLAAIKGWKVLVVGDLKAPSNWTYPGCTYLSVDQQKSLGYQLTAHLPYNSYTRKNLGYLYAIQNGARYIYDTDDDNHPIDGQLNSFYSDQTVSGLIYDDLSAPYFNPYAHFGQPSAWPRGYPLNDVARPAINSYKLCTFKRPAIQQGLVNGDPDVDAIYRLTKTTGQRPKLNMTFDGRAPPVTLPPGVFAPFNSQNTFFTYEALWSLYLPSSVAFRVTDIWRGYWAQRLLWLLGHKLAFFPPNAFQVRNSHNYFKDFQDEEQVYLQTSELIRFLSAWDCNNETSFFQCVRRLSNDMASSHFWDRSDAAAIDLWLSDLTAVGYEEPEMVNGTDYQECLPPTPPSEDPYTRVYFSSVGPTMSNGRDWRLAAVQEFCSKHLPVSIPSRPQNTFEQILLVVVFNFAHYGNIAMLNALYRDHFPTMVFCGQVASYEHLKDDVQQGAKGPGPPEAFSFINVTSSKGFFGYECAIRAMEMHYHVDGYLIVGDDVLFNFWNLKTVDMTRAQLDILAYQLVDRYLDPRAIADWDWWGGPFGQIPANMALNELYKMAVNLTGSSETTNQLVNRYVHNRYVSRVNMTQVSRGPADIYYVPRSVSEVFVAVMKIFLKHRVFLELAVPSTIAGLHAGQSVRADDGFRGVNLWAPKARKSVFRYYETSYHYLHPIKLSEVFKNDQIQKQYCTNFVDKWLKNW